VITLPVCENLAAGLPPCCDRYVDVNNFDLGRFVDAQRSTYGQAASELRAGRKETHWMWFIFPQIRGLGSSAMARKYAISSLDEARAYVSHAVLGPRLLECTRWVTAVAGRPVEEIFGYPDHLKFHSSLTLFAHAAPDEAAFGDALRQYFNSRFDEQTIRLLGCESTGL